MKKAKRYDDGGMTDEDVKSFAGTSDNDSTAGMAESTKEEAAPTKKQTFGEAFAAARKGGGKTFEFEGKKFTTDLAGSKSSAPKTTKASNEDYGNEGKRPVSKAARNILEEAKENVRRGNAARTSMAEANRPKMEAGRLPKKGPGLSNFKSGGMTSSSASRRADGIASKGKTRGKLC